jgi:hypothetical protein
MSVIPVRDFAELQLEKGRFQRSGQYSLVDESGVHATFVGPPIDSSGFTKVRIEIQHVRI